jgi:anti-sigma factor RsiW
VRTNVEFFSSGETPKALSMELTCHQVGELLSPYLDNELDATASLAVARHLEKCPACRAEADRLAEISTSLRESLRGGAHYAARAEVVNRRALEAIRESLPAPALRPTTGARGLRMAVWKPSIRRFPRTFAAAALIIVSATVGLIFALAPGRENALLANVIAMHDACVGWEGEELGNFCGEREVRRLAEQYKVPFPDLASVNMRVESAHTCRIRGAAFIHFYFVGDGARISVFYSRREGVARMRDCERDLTPGTTYNLHKSEMCALAFATARGEALWAVAGPISDAQAAAVAERLNGIAPSAAARGAAVIRPTDAPRLTAHADGASERRR